MKVLKGPCFWYQPLTKLTNLNIDVSSSKYSEEIVSLFRDNNKRIIYVFSQPIKHPYALHKYFEVRFSSSRN